MIDSTHPWQRDPFCRLCKEACVDRIDDRLVVFERFIGTDTDVSAAELTETLADDGVRFTPDFVLDTLHLCCHFGLAWPNRFKGGALTFTHPHLGQHQGRMICTQCGAILVFQDAFIKRLQQEISDAHGFQMRDHRMEIYGLCRKCHHRRSIPLSEARPGEQLKIRQLDGGAKIRGRLISMGILQDAVLEVITAPARGQLVVAVDGNRLVIGRGMAEKIRVDRCGSPFSSTECEDPDHR